MKHMLCLYPEQNVEYSGLPIQFLLWCKSTEFTLVIANFILLTAFYNLQKEEAKKSNEKKTLMETLRKRKQNTSSCGGKGSLQI